MMNFLKKIKKATPAVSAHERDAGGRILRDWGVILAVFVVLVLIAIFSNGYMLLKINRGDFFAAAPDTTLSPETLNRKTLLDVSAFFEARQSEYESLKATQSGSSAHIDPSL